MSKTIFMIRQDVRTNVVSSIWYWRDGKMGFFDTDPAAGPLRAKSWKASGLPDDDWRVFFAFSRVGYLIASRGPFETSEDWKDGKDLFRLADSAKVLKPEKLDYFSLAWWEDQANKSKPKRSLPVYAHPEVEAK